MKFTQKIYAREFYVRWLGTDGGAENIPLLIISRMVSLKKCKNM